ncbi:MAG: PP0621 family protein [Thioalkalivibrionaceae bacterium]
MRVLLLIAAIAAAFWIVRYLVSSRRPRTDARASSDERTLGETLVRCAHCGVHVPRSQALDRGGQLFCSEAHALAHDQSGDSSSNPSSNREDE